MAWPETVRKTDLKIDYYRGSGKGGQHRNKTDSACRMTHIPTGITTQSEEYKEQPQNRKAAWKRLVKVLVPLMRAAVKTEVKSKSNDRVRTYHEPRQQVKDHRNGRTYSYKEVLDGNGLAEVIEDVRREVAVEHRK